MRPFNDIQRLAYMNGATLEFRYGGPGYLAVDGGGPVVWRLVWTRSHPHGGEVIERESSDLGMVCAKILDALAGVDLKRPEGD